MNKLGFCTNVYCADDKLFTKDSFLLLFFTHTARIDEQCVVSRAQIYAATVDDVASSFVVRLNPNCTYNLLDRCHNNNILYCVRIAQAIRHRLKVESSKKHMRIYAEKF